MCGENTYKYFATSHKNIFLTEIFFCWQILSTLDHLHTITPTPAHVTHTPAHVTHTRTTITPRTKHIDSEGAAPTSSDHVDYPSCTPASCGTVSGQHPVTGRTGAIAREWLGGHAQWGEEEEEEVEGERGAGVDTPDRRYHLLTQFECNTLSNHDLID